jgi:TonB family protein
MDTESGLGRYYSQLLSQVDWHDAFPDWAIAEGIGGVTIVGLTLDQNGRVSALSIVRPSGIAEFDRNLLAAIRRDAPYGPLPAAAGARLRVNIAFDAMNPVVGREGVGPGGRTR